MISDYPAQQKNIDVVMDSLNDVFNTTKVTIRIVEEDRPIMTVISKLMKLDKDNIVYVLNEYEQQIRIRNHKNYLLTILYTARKQQHPDISNQAAINCGE